MKRGILAISIFAAFLGVVVLIVAGPQLFAVAADLFRGNGFIGEIHLTAGTPRGIVVSIAVLMLMAVSAWWLAGRLVKA